MFNVIFLAFLSLKFRSFFNPIRLNCLSISFLNFQPYLLKLDLEITENFLKALLNFLLFMFYLLFCSWSNILLVFRVYLFIRTRLISWSFPTLLL